MITQVSLDATARQITQKCLKLSCLNFDSISPPFWAITQLQLVLELREALFLEMNTLNFSQLEEIGREQDWSTIENSTAG